MVKHNLSFSVERRYIRFLREKKEYDNFNRSKWLENILDEMIEEEGWTDDK